MSLGADVAAALPELRAQAESLMRDSCIIHGEPTRTWNPDVLAYLETPTVVYSGKCRLKLGNTAVQESNAAGQIIVVQGAVLSVPIDGSGLVRTNNLVTMTFSEHDPALVGVVLRIEKAPTQSVATARRFPVVVS